MSSQTAMLCICLSRLSLKGLQACWQQQDLELPRPGKGCATPLNIVASKRNAHTSSVPLCIILCIIQAKFAARWDQLLTPKCMGRTNATQEEREQLINDLVREITALWQTDELRRRRPSALDGVCDLAPLHGQRHVGNDANMSQHVTWRPSDHPLVTSLWFVKDIVDAGLLQAALCEPRLPWMCMTCQSLRG